MSTSSYDAIVIGGGINGLVSACLLQKAGKRCLLLEAQDRLGGMAASVSPDGKSAEPGLALFGQALTPALAKRLGLALEKPAQTICRVTAVQIARGHDGDEGCVPASLQQRRDFGELRHVLGFVQRFQLDLR